MPASNGGRRSEAAGGFEIWAARAWNVFNEGRPFSIVYPVLVLLCAAPVGLAPDGSLLLALAGTLGAGRGALALQFPLRSRALLWLVGAGLDPAARALARAPAARRRAGRVPLLHGRALGLDLLPPAHRRAVDERAALLAARAHQLGPHQRQRARAGAEVRDDAQRRQPAGRGRRPRVGGLDRDRRRRSWPPRARSPGAAFARTRLPRYPERRAAGRAARRRRSPGAST